MANFYGTESKFGKYCEERGYTVPAGEVVPALYRASMFIDANFSFVGLKTGERDQQRSWPRVGAYDAEGWGYTETEIPWQVEHATYEACLREMTSPGSLQPDVTPGKVQTSATVVGAVSVQYAATGSADNQKPVLTVLRGILAPLLGGSAVNPFVGTTARAN